MILQELEIPQGEEFAGLEPCALKVLAEDRQRGHLPPPLGDKQNRFVRNNAKGADLCF